MKQRLYGTILLVVGIMFGCTVTPRPLPETDTTVESTALSFDLMRAAQRWEREVAERYPNAVVVAVHGRTDEQSGQWYAYPSVGEAVPVKDMVKSLRSNYPDRRIVLICCNPDGKVLTGVSNVAYADEMVWVVPDDQIGFTFRDLLGPSAVGSIWEFREQ